MDIDVTQSIINYDGEAFKAGVPAEQILGVLMGLFQQMDTGTPEDFRVFWKAVDDKMGQIKDRKDMVLRDVLLTALTKPHQADQNLGWEKKLLRDDLARRIYKQDSVDLDPGEDVKELKELINRAYTTPSIVAQAYAMLDVKSDGGPEKTKKRK